MREFRMAFRQRLLLVLLVVLLLCPASVHAQQSNSTVENSQTTDAALREKAFNLLETLANQISSLQSAENRARLGSNIAGSLWPHDEKRARTLFGLVEEDIKAGLQNPDSVDPRDVHTHMVFLRLREDTVNRIAKHDAELALAFLKATRPTLSRRSQSNFDTREQALELRLMKGIAVDNPELALKIGRQSLARGFSNDLVSLLRKLLQKHKEHGLSFYKEVVNKLKNVDLTLNGEALQFALSLAYSSRPPLGDESTFRHLINTIMTTAIANGCGNKGLNDQRAYFCNQIGSVVPFMEMVDPLRAGNLKHWTNSNYHSSPLNEAFNELYELSQNGTVDEVLALASSYPELEGNLRWQAISKAAESGDFDRAQRIATDYAGDSEFKARMLAQVERYQKFATMNAEFMAEFQRRLNLIRNVRERVWLLLQLANGLGPTDRKAALTTLNQASGLIDTMRPGKEQTEALIALAMMYCLEKSDRGFAIMETLVPKLNDLVGSAARLDGFDNRYLRDGEWNMTAEGGVGDLLTGLARGAGYFAWCDFDRAVSLAAQFDRTEIRLMGQLKLAQGILAGPPKRFSMANSMLP